MLDRNKWAQYGFERADADIQGICFHETGNTEMNAQDLFNYLNEESKTSNGCHYLCDANETIQVMPLDWAVYHTGKGLDWGNKHTVAIEICSSLSDDDYNSAQARAIALAKDIMQEYGITDDFVFFHNTFDDRMYCPKTILDRYSNVKRFIMEEF